MSDRFDMMVERLGLVMPSPHDNDQAVVKGMTTLVESLISAARETITHCGGCDGTGACILDSECLSCGEARKAIALVDNERKKAEQEGRTDDLSNRNE